MHSLKSTEPILLKATKSSPTIASFTIFGSAAGTYRRSDSDSEDTSLGADDTYSGLPSKLVTGKEYISESDISNSGLSSMVHRSGIFKENIEKTEGTKLQKLQFERTGEQSEHIDFGIADIC